VTPPRDPLVLRCPSCGMPLGVYNEDALTCGAARFTQRVSVVCACCRNVVGWRPGGERREREDAARG
jgi:primosomal protein N'